MDVDRLWNYVQFQRYQNRDWVYERNYEQKATANLLPYILSRLVFEKLKDDKRYPRAPNQCRDCIKRNIAQTYAGDA